MSRQSSKRLGWIADHLVPDSVVAGWFWPSQLAFRQRRLANRLHPRAARCARKRVRLPRPVATLPF